MLQICLAPSITRFLSQLIHIFPLSNFLKKNAGLILSKPWITTGLKKSIISRTISINQNLFIEIS